MAMFLIDSAIYYGADLVGFGYAGLKTFETIQKKNEEADTKWLIYWMMFAALYVVEFFVSPILNFVLFGQYHYIRFMLFVYLSLGGGAGALYKQHVLPNLKGKVPGLE